METLKIAMATDWFLPRVGGVEYHVATISELLTERGHEVHVLTNALFGQGKYPYVVHRIDKGINLRFWNVRVGYSMAKEIADIIKKEHYDIVHGHNYFSPISATAMNIASGIYGIPSIMTIHSMGEGPIRHMERFFANQATAKVTAFIAISSVTEEYLRNLLGKNMRARKVWRIPNGVDTERWKPPKNKEEAKEKIGVNGPIILTASRLSIRKRVNAVPKIAKMVVKEHPEAKFIIVGDGVERKTIETSIRQKKLGNNVIMVGAKPREEVVQYMKAADIYLDPTKIEALGMAVIEAQACGVPGLGYIKSGVRDIVENGKNGFLYRKDKEAAEQIKYLLDNPDELKRMGKHAREIAAERYDWKKIIKDLERAYRTTISDYEYRPYKIYEVWKRWKERKKSY